MSTKNLYINTIGCQMNVYDSEKIVKILKPLGYTTTNSIKDANLIILNTCAIREKAEQKAFSFLGRLVDLKKKNPDLIIGVGGCVAQQEGRQILKRVPWLDIIFGTHALTRLPQMIKRVESKKCRIIDINMNDDIDEFEISETQNNTSAINSFVTIMHGCDNFCTYCVVPYVRGREASRKPEYIIQEIKTLVNSGVKEVTLLGQNVNSYGQKEGLCSFSELLEKICCIKGLKRLRFTTSHPKDLSQELMYAFKNLDKLCSHIHLPVQSGSNTVLKKMNRKYTRELYLDKIDNLRSICPDIAITSDMIVGFPGETRLDFEQTLNLMKTVEYDGLFAFKYSDRPNAPASKFPEKVLEKEQKIRLQELLDLQEKFTIKKNKALIGSVQKVLVDGLSKRQKWKNGFQQDIIQWSGRTDTNKIVNFICNNQDLSHDLMGKTVQIKIEEAFANSLRGKPVIIKSFDLKGDNTYAA